MEGTTNLMKCPDVMQINQYKTLVINKKSESFVVYKIPLKYLFYNDKNDRISTEIVRYADENKMPIPDDREDYNDVFEKLIYESKPDALDKTMKSIETRGQDNPGVVLHDGRIIDGNRRFTCLRKIQKKTNIEQCFNAVILEYDYTDNYKLIKALELELQMGVEGPVDYDPIDRLFGIYNSIRIQKAFSPEEYAALFDDLSPADIRKKLGLADLMCEYLDFIGSPGKYYIAKDMKLDGVLNEIPAVLSNVKKRYPDLVDKTKTFIFTLILNNVDGQINVFVRNLKNIIEYGDYPKLLEDTEEPMQRTIDLIDENKINSAQDVADRICNHKEISEALKEAVSSEQGVVAIKKTTGAPIKRLREAKQTLQAIEPASVSEMSSEDMERAQELIGAINKMLKKISEQIEP